MSVDIIYKRVGRYRFVKALGKGSYGRVDLYMDKDTKQKVAIKCVPRSKQDERLEREIMYMLELRDVPNIIRILDVLQSREYVWIVMEYADRGELFDYIVKRGFLSLEESFSYFKQLCAALEHCHYEHNIVHRDLKPENILLAKRKEGGYRLVLTDFGFSNRLSSSLKSQTGHKNNTFDLMQTYCGSPYYASPEMIQGKPYVGTAADIWSLGVILYAMVFGRLPFDDPSTSRLFEKIIKADFSCPVQEMLQRTFDQTQLDACIPKQEYMMREYLLLENLLNGMLEKNAAKRFTLKQVMNHPWFLWMEDRCQRQRVEHVLVHCGNSIPNAPMKSAPEGKKVSKLTGILRKCSDFLKGRRTR